MIYQGEIIYLGITPQPNYMTKYTVGDIYA